jgi:hypothetical protein
MYGAEVFPDIELLVTGWLRTVLPTRPEAYASGVRVSNRLPATRPARAVVVRRDGGRRASHVTEVAPLAVNVWAATDQDAADLSRLIAALLMSEAPPPIEHVEGGGFSSIPDESGAFRRFGMFELTVTPEPLPMP